MAVSDKLFELIKSLTKQEKIYFKTYAKSNKGDSKNYIQLFNAIADQKIYDEQKIKQKFKNERFVKQLSVAKDYLFKMIMKSLRNYDDFNPPLHIELQQMLHEIKILAEKALYHSCEKVIQKAEKLAAESEMFLYLSYVLGWKRIILLSRGEYLENRKKIQTILKEQTTALEKEKNVILFRDLYDNLSAIAINSMTIRDKEKKQEIDGIMHNPLLSSVNMAMGFLSKLHFYNIHHIYFKQLRNRPQSYLYSTNVVMLFESKEHGLFLTEYKERYCMALINLLIDQAWLRKESEFNKTIHKLNTFLDKYRELKIIVFPRTYIARTLLFELIGKFDEVSSLVDEFEKEMAQFKGEVPKERLTILYSNFATMYMGKQDYKKALYWNNKVLNETPKELLVDFYCASLILDLLIHYELGNSELLESLTRSTHRYLLQRRNLFKFEDAFIKFIRIQLPKVNDQEGLIEAFKKLKEQFVEFQKDNFEKAGMDIFDYISWLESKIENRPFAEIVREKGASNSYFQFATL